MGCGRCLELLFIIAYPETFEKVCFIAPLLPIPHGSCCWDKLDPKHITERYQVKYFCLKWSWLLLESCCLVNAKKFCSLWSGRWRKSRRLLQRPKFWERWKRRGQLTVALFHISKGNLFSLCLVLFFLEWPTAQFVCVETIWENKVYVSRMCHSILPTKLIPSHTVKHLPPTKNTIKWNWASDFLKNPMNISNSKVILNQENKDRVPAGLNLKLSIFLTARTFSCMNHLPEDAEVTRSPKSVFAFFFFS